MDEEIRFDVVTSWEGSPRLRTCAPSSHLRAAITIEPAMQLLRRWGPHPEGNMQA